MKILYRLGSFLLIFSFVILPMAPVFALGEVTVETNAPIVAEPTPTSPSEPVPVSTPEPTPTPETVSTPSVTETTPETNTVTEPIVETVTAGDTSAPNITGILAISVLPTEENIAWTTGELSTSNLEYGTTLSYGSNITLSATAGLAHLAVITGLTPSTRYYYCIRSTDLADNIANSCGHEFTTEAENGETGGNISNNTGHLIDTTVPDISLVTITSVNTTSATINWATSEVANAEVEYGVSAGYGNATPLDTSLSLTHSVTLNNLSPDTEYHYRIRTADEVGNTTISPDNTFTTASLISGQINLTVPETNTDTDAGNANLSTNQQLLILGIETASISGTSATIAWTTDLPSDSQIEYGDSQNLGSFTVLNVTLATSHSVIISNLSENTNYIFRVKSKPVGTSVAIVSGLHEFTTLSHSTPVIPPANVSAVSSSNITNGGATITWNTDQGATSQVEYGLSTGYGEHSSLNTSLISSHSVALANLDPLTTYHYRVKSTDAVGNVTFSGDHAFTTLGLSSINGVSQPTTEVTPPGAVSNLSIGGYDQSSAVLVWQATSEQSDISLEYDIRYSQSPITAENYGNATEAQLTPVYHGDLDPQGTEREYIVAGLNPSITYYFAIKSKHQQGDWSGISNIVSVKTTAGASVNAENSNVTTGGSTQSGSSGNTGGGSLLSIGYGSGSGGNAKSSFEPTTLKAEPANNQIIFEWNNPGETNFVRTVIIRKAGSYPSNPSDGQTIYEGRGQTFTDTNVENGKTYYYSLYSYNHSKTYSSPVRVSLAPKSGNDQVKFNETGSIIPFSPIMHFTRMYKRGDKNIEVEHLQEILALEKVSFPENLITGYFGTITEKALKQFQIKYQLVSSGIVDEATQAKLNSIPHSEKRLAETGNLALFATDFKLGNQSELVKNLQEFLTYEGSYSEAQITGYFGSTTKNAVMKFQRKYNITPVSGYVGYKTRHRMQQLTGF